LNDKKRAQRYEHYKRDPEDTYDYDGHSFPSRHLGGTYVDAGYDEAVNPLDKRMDAYQKLEKLKQETNNPDIIRSIDSQLKDNSFVEGMIKNKEDEMQKLEVLKQKLHKKDGNIPFYILKRLHNWAGRISAKRELRLLSSRSCHKEIIERAKSYLADQNPKP